MLNKDQLSLLLIIICREKVVTWEGLGLKWRAGKICHVQREFGSLDMKPLKHIPSVSFFSRFVSIFSVFL